MKIEKITRTGYSSTLSKDQLWDIYKSMKTQRLLEDRLLKMYKGGQLSGAVYPGIGQEASMAGIAAGMADTDIFGGTHRDLGVQIAKGVTLKEIALNFFGILDCFNLLKRMFCHAFGQIDPQEAVYLRKNDYPKVFLVARIWVLIYLLTLTVTLWTWSIIPLMLIGLPRLYGAWHHVKSYTPQRAQRKSTVELLSLIHI